jgi:hypothetical protein
VRFPDCELVVSVMESQYIQAVLSSSYFKNHRGVRSDQKQELGVFGRRNEVVR